MKNITSNMVIISRRVLGSFFINSLGLLVSLLILASCTDDSLQSTGGSSVTPDGKVLLTLSLKVPAQEKSQTRASLDDSSVSTLDILVFDASNQLSQLPASAQFIGTSWKVALSPNNNEQDVIALANISASQREALESCVVGTSYDEVRTALNTKDGIVDGLKIPLIMCSKTIKTPISPTMGAKNLTLLRTSAKIDVLSNASGFVLESVQLLNASDANSPLPFIALGSVLQADLLNYSAVDALNNSVINAIYCYEREPQEDSPMKVLVKGRYKNARSGYYLLNLVYLDDDNNKSYVVRRNHKYEIMIKSVNSTGYENLADAMNSAAMNDMMAEISVTDNETTDIISDGRNYIGFSNSECIFYTSTDHSNVVVSTYTHNLPQSMVSNVSITAQGTGLTLNTTSLNQDGSKPGEIRVTVTKAFESGKVIITSGALTKEIVVSRVNELLSYGGAFSLDESFVFARKLTVDESTNWIKLSSNSDGSDAENEVVASSGPIHMHLDINLSLLGGKNRGCDLICSRKNEEGRVRVKVEQYAFDIFQYEGQINNTYVGTFHRWNEIGERIITMPNPGGIWVAQVVAGQDFIRLAEGGSGDTSIGTDKPGDAESFPVISNKTVLVNTEGGEIKFRVGMSGKLKSKDDQPRYGLIIVSHSGGTNRVFVRQGEAADYVMRKTDLIKGPDVGGMADVTLGERPNAVRFAPYNLMDPNKSLEKRADLSNNGGVFVAYPSMAGYHFKPNQPYAWPITVQSASDFANSSARDSDPCPPNYRRPLDGPDNNGGFVIGSEMRQSLWYYPKNGGAKSDYYNTIRGCLADGYFDRRKQMSKKILSSSGKETLYNSIEVGVDIDKAYIGTIIFNPMTNASIFLPAAGLRGNFLNYPVLYDLGVSTIWASHTLQNTQSYWGAAMELPAAMVDFTFDNYGVMKNTACSMRCVAAD